MALRYGENPSQRAALYVTEEPRGIRDLKQRQGKELSFNNLLDIDAAMWAVALLEHPRRLLHRQAHHPLRHRRSAARPRRRSSGPAPSIRVSAFGGVVAFNTVVDRATAEAMSDLFLEVVVAPSFHDEALAGPRRQEEPPRRRAADQPRHRRARLQAGARRLPGAGPVRARSRRDRLDACPPTAQPTDAEWDDLRFAWAAVASVKSNAILLARDEQAIGIGAGQMSRVDSVFLAVHKARQQGHDPGGQRPRLRRVLPLRRRRRGSGGGRHHRDHPAGRLGARRRGDRGGRPARHRDGADRHTGMFRH